MSQIIEDIKNNPDTAPLLNRSSLARDLASISLELNKLGKEVDKDRNSKAASEIAQAVEALRQFGARQTADIKYRIHWMLQDIFETLDLEVLKVVAESLGKSDNSEVIEAMNALGQWGTSEPDECQAQIASERLNIHRACLALSLENDADKEFWQSKTRDSEAYVSAIKYEKDAVLRAEREKEKDQEARARQRKPQGPWR